MSGPSDATERFLREMKIALRRELINEVPDEFFEPGREDELGRRIMEVVDTRLFADKVPIGQQLRLRLIESILADIERAKREKLGGS